MEREPCFVKRKAEALIEVHRRCGEQVLLLIHIATQAQPDPDFAARVFLCNSWAFDKFRKPACSVSVLGDKNKSWRPDYHTEDYLEKATVSFGFPMRKLLDYDSPEVLADLAKSTNPFAQLVVATLQTLERESKMPGFVSGAKPESDEKTLEVARRMLARGAERAFILEVTELSERELAMLEKE